MCAVGYFTNLACIPDMQLGEPCPLPLHAMTIPKVSKHCQMFPDGKIFQDWETHCFRVIPFKWQRICFFSDSLSITVRGQLLWHSLELTGPVVLAKKWASSGNCHIFRERALAGGDILVCGWGVGEDSIIHSFSDYFFIYFTVYQGYPVFRETHRVFCSEQKLNTVLVLMHLEVII